jgi:hypothetical protein
MVAKRIGGEAVEVPKRTLSSVMRPLLEWATTHEGGS